MSRIHLLRLIVAVSLAALSLTLLIWGITTPQRTVRRQVIQPAQMQLADESSAAAVPETRLLTLEYPPSIRAGESDRLQMTVEVQQQAQAAGLPNVYETHQVFAETHLDMGGINLQPSSTVSEPMRKGQPVTFFWSVHPGETGHFQGTIWLYLRFIPKAGGPEIRRAISAQTIEIESTSFLGLRSEAALPLSIWGIFLSALLGFSFVVDGVKWLFKKR